MQTVHVLDLQQSLLWQKIYVGQASLDSLGQEWLHVLSSNSGQNLDRKYVMTAHNTQMAARSNPGNQVNTIVAITKKVQDVNKIR